MLLWTRSLCAWFDFVCPPGQCDCIVAIALLGNWPVKMLTRPTSKRAQPFRIPSHPSNSAEQGDFVLHCASSIWFTGQAVNTRKPPLNWYRNHLIGGDNLVEWVSWPLQWRVMSFRRGQLMVVKIVHYLLYAHHLHLMFELTITSKTSTRFAWFFNRYFIL